MKNAEDLWNLLTWLEVETHNFYQFKHRYCILGGFRGKQVLGHKNLDELRMKLSSVMLRRKKEEVLDLPPKIYSTEYIEMTARQKLKYEEIRQGILLTLDDELTLLNPLSTLTRLRQCVVSLEILDAGKDSPKIDRIKELLEEEIIPHGKKAIIFSNWTTVTRILRERLKEYNPAYITGEVKLEDRDAQVQKFQEDDTCKVCIGTIPAMGTGLTLTAGSYVLFTDKYWLKTDNEQAEDRAHRIGQDNPVQVVSFVTVGTIEEKMELLLENREELFANIVDGKGTEGGAKDLIMWLLE
jgi:SNF2 family DNA or RNA helicase